MSSLKRAADIKQLVNQHYEEHRQDRNYRRVWLNHVFPRFAVSYKVCLAAMTTNTDALESLMAERLKLERQKLLDESRKRNDARKASSGEKRS